MVKRRTSMKAFLLARVFVAFCTLVTLTATIMHRPDHDGYQGTHLFFMPRKNWEMDEGRGMLYEEEHYRKADLYSAAAELYGEESLEGFEGELERDREREEEYKRNMRNMKSTKLPAAKKPPVRPSARCLISQTSQETRYL